LHPRGQPEHGQVVRSMQVGIAVLAYSIEPMITKVTVNLNIDKLNKISKSTVINYSRKEGGAANHLIG